MGKLLTGKARDWHKISMSMVYLAGQVYVKYLEWVQLNKWTNKIIETETKNQKDQKDIQIYALD